MSNMLGDKFRGYVNGDLVGRLRVEQEEQPKGAGKHVQHKASLSTAFFILLLVAFPAISPLPIWHVTYIHSQHDAISQEWMSPFMGILSWSQVKVVKN